MATPTILEVENAIIALLDAPLKALKTKTIAFPDDYEKSGRPYLKNYAIVGFNNLDLDTPQAAGVMGCLPVTQVASWNFEVLLSSQRLSCGNPSTPGMYELIDTTIDSLCGKRPFETMGPLWIGDVTYVGREDGFYQYTISVNMEGKRACTDNAVISSVWQNPIAG